MMDLRKRSRLICWILYYNVATPSCVLWKHRCTHFPIFMLKNIPKKLGFWNDVSKNTQIYRSILVLIIFVCAKVGVLSGGYMEGHVQKYFIHIWIFSIYKLLVKGEIRKLTAGTTVQQPLAQVINSCWHNSSTVTGMIVQQSLAQFFNIYWHDSSTITVMIIQINSPCYSFIDRASLRPNSSNDYHWHAKYLQTDWLSSLFGWKEFP